MKKSLLFLFILPTISYSETLPSVYFTPGSDCEEHIIEAINNSKQKVLIDVYSITNYNIKESIKRAFDKGINIRIITDKTMAKGKGSAVPELQQYGIPVITNKKHKIEHNKFAIFDDSLIVTGSYNWTENASKYNSENCIFLNQEIEKYTERFEYLWSLYNQPSNTTKKWSWF